MMGECLRWTGRSVAGLVLASLVPGDLWSAENDPVREAVTQLLDLGWASSLEQSKKADRCWAQLPPDVQNDGRAGYAYVLALIKQRRYAEAAEKVDQLVARDGKNVAAWRAKIWLAMLTKRYAEALADMAKLADLLATQVKAPGQDELCTMAAGEMGTACGFLDGPAEAALAVAQRNAQRDKILARLDPPRKDAFESSRRRVLNLHASYLTQQDDAAKKAKQEASERREETLKELKSQRDRIAEERAQVDEQGEKLQAGLRYEHEKLAAAERPLVAEMAGLQTALKGTLAQRRDVERAIVALEEMLAREKDPSWRERMLLDSQRLQLQRSGILARLTELQRQVAVVNTRLAQVRAQRAATQAGFEDGLRRAGQELEDLERQEKVTAATEAKTRQAKGDTRRASSLATRAAAFTTYAPFPLEEEKLRLLGSF
jgi:hypothetical protein